MISALMMQAISSNATPKTETLQVGLLLPGNSINNTALYLSIAKTQEQEPHTN